MSESVGIIGAGIVGLAHAYSAARRGHEVIVFERSPHASGASIRNFGMIWPIGQPSRPMLEIALRSRQTWLELASESDLWVNPCGSIHLAHQEDEWVVLREFAERAADLGYSCELLTPSQVHERTPAANPKGLLGGLFSSTELAVNPVRAIRDLPTYLTERWGVHFEFSTTVLQAADGWVAASDGRSWPMDRTIICGGADFETLYPRIFQSSGLKRCKLQMMKTVPKTDGWNLGPHLASGLTLRHYANFGICPGMAAVKDRIAAETPELDRYGIHVMASQNDAGEIILGDSHEYETAIEPFDKSEIDALMLRELQKILRLPDWTIIERWHGIYAKHPSDPIYGVDPMENVHIRTGTGGAGMTMSFGLAEQSWEAWS